MDIYYNAEYVEVNNNISISETFSEDADIDPVIYLKVLSALIIRAGLFIAEVISIPSSNVQVLVLHNMIDLSVTLVGYGLIGYVFAYGKDFHSFIGISGFVNEKSNFNEFIQGWTVSVVVSGLLTAAIGDRISFFAGLVMNLLLSCIALPVLFHWVLCSKGWMRAMNFAGVSVSYKDYSHSCLMHMAGGYISFLGMFVLDKRMLRFKDLDSSSIPDIGPNLALFGYFLTLLGFVGFSVPSQKYVETHILYNFYGIILVNMIFAIVGTMMMTLLLTFVCPCRDRVSKWANLRFVQGGISGVAVIAGGVDLYHPLTALGAGLLNGIVFFVETHIMSKTNLEDFCNISAVHFFSGFLGTLLPPILGTREGFRSEPYTDFIHFAWQFLCDLTILTYLGIIFYPVLALFDRCGVLRTWEEEVNHKRAISTMKIIPKMSLKKRFFDWGDSDFNPSHMDSGVKSRTLGDDSREQRSEKVNILYQKNGSERAVHLTKLPIHGKGDEFSKEPCADNQKTFADYLADPKAILPLFEELDTVSRKTSGSMAREEGIGAPNDSKIYEMKVFKGIRNISDSKLFNRLKESVGKTIGKKHNCESRSGVSSISNTLVPSTSGMQFSLETEV